MVVHLRITIIKEEEEGVHSVFPWIITCALVFEKHLLKGFVHVSLRVPGFTTFFNSAR